MLKYSTLFFAILMACHSVQAQQWEGDASDYDVKVGTTPTRSMAAGLVKPDSSGTVHGGVDFTHESGWYAGQWSPSMGLSSTQALELDSYVGFKHPFDNTMGYEVGVIHYSFPDLDGSDSHEVYAGLRVMGSRFGAAYSNSVTQRDSTLFADLGGLPLLNMDMTMKVTNHALDTPLEIDEGTPVRGFNDWSLQLSRSLMGVALNFIYSGSNLNTNNCVAYSGRESECTGTFMVKAQTSFF